MEWQPIETAPKDGTIIDLWFPTYGRVVDMWWAETEWSAGPGELPSHWMPLPPPPGEPSDLEKQQMALKNMRDHLD